jgi:cell division topological specificity factor
MSFLERIFGAAEPKSGSVAKERLKLVLEYDRALISPGELDMIREDIIESISRHVSVNRDQVQVSLEQGGRLVAEVPLRNRRGGGGESF